MMANRNRRRPDSVDASNAEYVRDDMLTCKVCLDQYNLSDQRPRALHCQHTFCERCLQDCLLKRNKVVCPLCRVRTRFASQQDGIKNLPINATAANIVTSRRQNYRASSRTQDFSANKIHKVEATTVDRLHPTRSELNSDQQSQQPGVGNTLASGDTQKLPTSDNASNLSSTNGNQSTSLSNGPPADEWLPNQLHNNGNQRCVRFQTTPQSRSCNCVHGPVPDATALPAVTRPMAPSAIYVGKFGKHYDAAGGIGGQPYRPGAFISPSYVACSPPVGGAGRVVVVDRAISTVQLFTANGDVLSAFQQIGACAACFVDSADGKAGADQHRVAVASGQGVSIYDQLGRLEKTIPLPDVVAVAGYQRGFVAAHKTRLSVCSRFTPTVSMSTINSFVSPKTTYGQFRNIVDVAISGFAPAGSGSNRSASVCVLDIDGVYLVDPVSSILNGVIPLNAVDPLTQIMPHPVSVAVDPSTGFVIVSDSLSRQVRMYDGSKIDESGSRLLRCLVQLGFDNGSAAMSSGIGICGHVAVSSSRILYVIVSGPGVAEVRMYRL